jgi:ATP-dependent RNA helicase DDX42
MNQFNHDSGEKVQQFAITESEYQLEGDREEDPLDVFMDNLDMEKEVSGHSAQIGSLFTSDDEETPVELMDRVLNQTTHAKEDNPFDEDSHGPKRNIDSISNIDHSKVTYAPFKHDFYKEHPSISGLSSGEIADLRRELGISVTGSNIPRCVCSFAQLSLPDSVLSVLRFLEYTTPTPIQSQSIPCLLAGRDAIGIAMTGSGKTMAYLIPAIVHALGNERQTPNPRVLIVCPTRELAIQIEQEAYRFARKGNHVLNSIALTGGLSKHEQFKELHKGADIVVGNPGRILDLVQMKKGLNISHVTFCVLDEADRMFKMGFESQVRTIIQRIRPDRQIALFSATMPPRIERMCRDILRDPIRIVVGAVGQASSLIDRNVFIVHSDDEKLVWLKSTLPSLLAVADSRIMIFVNSRSRIDELLVQIRQITPINASGLSSELDQQDRMRIMSEFKSGACPILIATDVASRGIDVPRVTCVIEFDAARDFDTHTHRIGRTGRAGFTGTSWTLIGKDEAKLAAFIVESMEAIGAGVVGHLNPALMELAMTHAPFRAARILAEEETRKLKTSHKESHWEGMSEHFVKKARLNEEGEVEEDEGRGEVDNQNVD